MANSNRGGKSTRQSEFEALDPALQQRIRRTLKIAGVWSAGILGSAFLFLLAKPYINKKRLERMKQPGYKPRVVPRNSLPQAQHSQSKREK